MSERSESATERSSGEVKQSQQKKEIKIYYDSGLTINLHRN